MEPKSEVRERLREIEETEKAVCRAVWRVLDEMRDEVDDLDRDLYRMIRERMEEEIAYGPEES